MSKYLIDTIVSKSVLLTLYSVKKCLTGSLSVLFQVFLSGKGLDRKGTDSIWDLTTTFQAYDPVAVIAAVPSLKLRSAGRKGQPMVREVGEPS